METIFISIAILLSVIFIGYSQYIKRRFGELSSVSASSYVLPEDEKWKFWLALWSVGMLNFSFVLYIGSYAFLASVGIIFAGVTLSHGRYPGKVPHTVGTVVSIVATFIGIAVIHNIWLPLILTVIGIGGITLSSLENKIWKIERLSMVLASIGYIMMILL